MEIEVAPIPAANPSFPSNSATTTDALASGLIEDDIIDIESPASISGKNQGSDLYQNKMTYPALVGLDDSKSKAFRLAEEAKEILVPLSEKADNLRFLADYVITRKN